MLIANFPGVSYLSLSTVDVTTESWLLPFDASRDSVLAH